LRVGYFGSYARGDWGVGSDLDLILIVENDDLSIERRSVRFDATGLPVPADLLVYTREEWASLASGTAFGRVVEQEAIWVLNRETY
jgi:hypothetical protein